MEKDASTLSRELFFKTGKIGYYNFSNAIDNCEILYKDVYEKEGSVSRFKLKNSFSVDRER